MIWVKPTRGGPAPASATFTAGTTKITVAAGAPTLQTGWTITKMVGICMQSMDPHGELEPAVISYVEDNSSPYSADITGLTTSQLYTVAAFFIYTDDTGATQWGAQINATATPT
jgi:hypothetical protein